MSEQLLKEILCELKLLREDLAKSTENINKAAARINGIGLGTALKILSGGK